MPKVIPTGPYIVEIDTNIKRAEGVHLTQPRVLISGRNGSGKTARLNAIDLALFGSADDVIGRDTVKTSALLRELDSTGLIHARIKMSDDTEASWSLGPSGKAKHRPLAIPVHQPLKDALTALSGSRAVTLRYLYDTFAKGPTTTIADEAKARGLASSHKAAANAVQSVIDTLNLAPVVNKNHDLVRAIGTLTRWQVASRKKTCGTCGEKPPKGTFQARYDRVSSKLADLPALTNDGIQGLLAAREESTRLAKYHKQHAKKQMDMMASWFEANREELEEQISGEQLGPLGPIGIKSMNSYILIGRKEGDLVWPVVSGAEGIMLAMTLVKAAPRKPGLNLMIVPDRDFDLNMFRALLRLSTSITDANVFIQSTYTPKVVPTHWDNVHLDG